MDLTSTLEAVFIAVTLDLAKRRVISRKIMGQERVISELHLAIRIVILQVAEGLVSLNRVLAADLDRNF